MDLYIVGNVSFVIQPSLLLHHSGKQKSEMSQISLEYNVHLNEGRDIWGMYYTQVTAGVQRKYL